MTATALTTLERVKRYLKQDQTYTDDDVLLTDLLNAVSQEFRSFASQDFDIAQYTEVYAGTGNRYLQLAQGPVKSIVQVKVNGYEVLPSTNGGASGYTQAGKALYAIGFWPCGPANVEVTYIAGYDSVPEDVQQACVQVVALRYKLKESEGMQSRAKGEAVDTFDRKDIPDYAQAALSRYSEPDLAIPVSSVKTAPPPGP